jgi:uncharacterized protein YqgQ
MMELHNYIAVNEFCESHGITLHFVKQLHEYGMIEIVELKNMKYITQEELPKAEKIVRLYSDLDINLEGIEVIDQLLDRIERMQKEIILLRNKLGLYE